MVARTTSYIIENDRDFERAIELAKSVTTNLKPAFTSIASDFYRSNRIIFSLKGPGLYPDLSEKPFTAWWEKDDDLNKHYEGGYKQYKQEKYGSAYPILRATGALERSITRRGAPGSVEFIGRQSLILGTAIEYGVYHQSDEPRSRIPQRKFLFISGGEKEISRDSRIAGRRERWLRILFRYIQVNFRNRGF